MPNREDGVSQNVRSYSSFSHVLGKTEWLIVSHAAVRKYTLDLAIRRKSASQELGLCGGVEC